MKVFIACDSFKNSMTSSVANEKIKKALTEKYSNISIKTANISDGGEGFVKSLTNKIYKVKVTNPIGKKITSFIGFVDEDTAVIEMSSASGIELINEKQKNPFNTTTYGTGELILNALDRGAKKIIIGLGGSATNDLGVGMLQALGVRFFDEHNNEVGIFGRDIFNIKKFNVLKMDKRIKYTNFIIAADVTNPLFGKNGASYVYGGQKGLNDADIEKFDQEFIRLSKLFNTYDYKNSWKTKGSGAAGGLGYSIITFLGGKIQSGFNILSEIKNLDQELSDIDVLITGEGKIDTQTNSGKAPYKIAELAKLNSPNVKVIAFAGVVSTGISKGIFDTIININEGHDGKNPLRKGPKRIYLAAKTLNI